MVAWTGDGLVAGYSPADNEWNENVYHLASPGTVDLNAITRIQYPLPATVNPDNHPNRLTIKAPFQFTSADFAAHPGATERGKGLTAGAFLIKASAFPSGTVPTPSQIINKGYNNLLWWAGDLVFHSPTTRQFIINGWTPAYLDYGTKYWLLVFPAFYNENRENPLRVMNNTNIDTIGRVISLWTNRRPNKPVITSPANNTTVAAGTVVNFKFTSNDPDASGGADRYDRDIAGVQVAYAPPPTAEVPDPQWRLLYYKRPDTGAVTTTSVYMNEEDVLAGDGRISMINNLGFPLRIGDEIPNVLGEAGLPSGTWLVRVRTADYGNPYPTLPNNANGKYPGITSINQINETNVSPWSDPIKISVFQQVPPPIPLRPKGSLAIPDDAPVRMSWLYRNTFDPPYDQYTRSVQIRRVGEEDWHWLLDKHVSEETDLTIPAGHIIDVPPDPIPGPVENLTDGGFESGSVEPGWTFSGTRLDTFEDETLFPETVTGTAGSGVHTGTRAMRFPDPSGQAFLVTGALNPPVDFDPAHNSVKIGVWIRVGPAVNFVRVQAIWADSEGGGVGGHVEVERGDLSGESPWTSDQWMHFDLPPLRRPPGGVTPTMSLLMSAADFTPPGVNGWPRIDDASFVTSYVDPGYGPLTLESTEEYEWRVAVTDRSFTANGESEWSEPANFWIVPSGDSGVVKPIPDQTIEGATLGCGTHRVFVYRRGGKERVGEITDMQHIDWSRVRDDISTAKIVVVGWGPDCGELLKRLQTWAYELVIFRDNGYSVDRVWEGPITLLTYEDGSVTIQAKDVMGYAYRRIIRQAMNDSGNVETNPTAGRSVVERATQALQNAFAPDDPNILGYLTAISNTSDAKQYRSIPAYSRTAFEEIDDMAANAGLDYTAVGRRILLWGTKSRIGTLPEFRDKDLGSSPIVSEYGMSTANVYSVSDGNGVHGEASRLNADGEDPIYGLIEMLSSTWASDSPQDTGSYTQQGIATIIESFKEHAERSIADRYPPPVVVRVPDNTTLNPETVISIQQLVPGVVIPLRSTGTLRTVRADQKLDSVTVTEEGGNETITVVMSPFSKDDENLTDGGEDL